MSTRALLLCPDSRQPSDEHGPRYVGLYVTHDGYPLWTGATLARHYADPSRVRYLYEMGDVYALGAAPQAPADGWPDDSDALEWVTANERHTKFYGREFGHVAAYAGGEFGTPDDPRPKTLDAALAFARESIAQYVYVYAHVFHTWAAHEVTRDEVSPVPLALFPSSRKSDPLRLPMPSDMDEHGRAYRFLGEPEAHRPEWAAYTEPQKGGGTRLRVVHRTGPMSQSMEDTVHGLSEFNATALRLRAALQAHQDRIDQAYEETHGRPPSKGRERMEALRERLSAELDDPESGTRAEVDEKARRLAESAAPQAKIGACVFRDENDERHVRVYRERDGFDCARATRTRGGGWSFGTNSFLSSMHQTQEEAQAAARDWIENGVPPETCPRCKVGPGHKHKPYCDRQPAPTVTEEDTPAGRQCLLFPREPGEARTVSTEPQTYGQLAIF